MIVVSEQPFLTRVVYWLWDEAPEWMDWPIDHGLERMASWLRCKRHGHAPYVEMDNITIVCAYCNTKPGEVEK